MQSGHNAVHIKTCAAYEYHLVKDTMEGGGGRELHRP